MCSCTVPGPVSGLSATPGVVQLTISWSPPSEPNGRITMYQISYNTGVEYNTSATQHTLRDLPPNTVFVFSIRAYTIIGPGENVTDQASTTSTIRMYAFTVICSITNSISILYWLCSSCYWSECGSTEQYSSYCHVDSSNTTRNGVLLHHTILFCYKARE